MHRLCVFCGSRVGARPIYTEAARALGRTLADRSLGLVYGGGHIGLMGVLADALLAAGGEVIGVIPRSMVDKELAHERVTQLEVVDTMHQRKARMADLADGFIALPGGYGTGDELFEILTWAQLGIHAKPVGLLNVAGYFDPLLAWIDRAVEEDFIRPPHRQLLLRADDAEALVEMLLSAHPQPQLPKWVQPEER